MVKKWLLYVLLFHKVSAVTEFSSYQESLNNDTTSVIQLQFPYNVNADYTISNAVGTGAGVSVTAGNNSVSLTAGTTAAGNASFVSRARLNYQSGQSYTSIFGTQFAVATANHIQEVGIGNAEITSATLQEGLFFGYNGTTFGIWQRRSGIADTFISQATWNGDRVNGSGVINNPSGVTLNPQSGNVYRIQYKDVGYGAAEFYIENPNNGEWILVHTIRYSNMNTRTLFANSSLRLRAAIKNNGNTTNRTMIVSAMSASVEGQYNTSLQRRASAAASKAITTTMTNIVTIRNDSTYNSGNNQVLVQPDMISFLQPDNINSTEFVLYLNPAVGGSPSFTPTPNNSNSVVSIDTAGTTVTGGKQLGVFYLANDRLAELTPVRGTGFLTFSVGAPELVYNERYVYSLKKLDIVLYPGDRLVLAAATKAGTGTGYASLSWQERF